MARVTLQTSWPIRGIQRLMKDIIAFAGYLNTMLTELYPVVNAVTATTGGGTTGLIPAGSSFVTVTSDSANKQISLPAAEVGDRPLTVKVGSTGCELISTVAAHTLNNVIIGATNEAALTANNTYLLQYVATNTWIMTGWTNLGAVQTAVIPDAL